MEVEKAGVRAPPVMKEVFKRVLVVVDHQLKPSDAESALFVALFSNALRTRELASSLFT